MTEQKAHISVDLPEDLYRELERRAVPFQDTGPVDVIRRLLAVKPYANSSPKALQREGHLAALLRHDLITVGDDLVYARRDGRSFAATVTGDGCIKLSDGRAVRSPSGAIMLLVGTTDNGFKAWRHVKSGKKLEELRAKLPATDLRGASFP